MFEMMLSILRADVLPQSFLPINGNPPIVGFDWCTGETTTEWWLMFGNPGSGNTSNLWHYDGVTNIWTLHGPVVADISSLNGAMGYYNGKLYWSYNINHWEYTVATRTWFKLPAVPLDYRDYALVSFKYKNELYYFGGATTAISAGVLRLTKYIPTTGWVPVSTYPATTSMLSPRVALIGDKVYFTSYSPSYQQLIRCYDFITATWETIPVPELTHTRRCAMVAVGTDIYFIGFDEATPNKVLKFDTLTKTITTVANLIVPRVSPVGMVVDNNLYIYAGGTTAPVQINNSVKTMLVYPLS